MPVTRSLTRALTRKLYGSAVGVVPGLIAFWDWTGADDTARLTSKVGAHVLQQGAGATVTFATDGPGQAAVFDGTTDFLRIPEGEVGDLNIGLNYGNACTVFAFVKRTPTATADFVLGCWQEDNSNPKRQYGMFVDLTGWNGDERVNGHVSKSGGATPGYIYSRDTSVNSRKMMASKWYFVAFTYDGQYSRAYLGSALDLVPTYTDSSLNTYPHNPYPFPDGLNATPCDFTIGAVKLTAGMDNFLSGRIGPCGVYKGALTQAQLTTLMRSLMTPGDPVYEFDFYVTANSNPRDIGWQSASASGIYTDDASGTPHMYFGASTTGGGKEFQSRLSTTANIPVVAWSPELAGLLLSEITSVSFLLNSSYITSALRIVIKVGGQWYATDATFDLATPGVSASDWSLAVTKTFSFNRLAATWRDLTFSPGSVLSLAGAARSSDIPDGELQNIGWYSPNNGGNIRIDDLKVFA